MPSPNKIIRNSFCKAPELRRLGTTPISKRSRSEKAILGALGEFRGILGAALGIENVILGIRNFILGMASHVLSNTKATILGATPAAIPGIDGNPPENCSFALSEHFSRIGMVPARQKNCG